MKRFIETIGLVIALTLTLAACSGSASSSSGSASASSEDNSGVTLNVTMSEFKYNPSSWTVLAGKPVTVNLDNTGSDPHTWTVMSKPIKGTYTFADRSDILFDSGRVSSGSTKTVSFTAPSTPGNYQVICTVRGHFDAGMVGQLVVK